jgi:hypothetical protein
MGMSQDYTLDDVDERPDQPDAERSAGAIENAPAKRKTPNLGISLPSGGMGFGLSKRQVVLITAVVAVVSCSICGAAAALRATRRLPKTEPGRYRIPRQGRDSPRRQ